MAKKIAGLILSAGYSSRMGELKALLPFGDEMVIVRQINCFIEAGVSDVFIVVGYEADQIREALRNYPVQFICNENYSDGMFSSVQSGLKNIKDKFFDAFFLLPVDFPLIQPYTLEMLIKKFKEDTASIIYPSYNYRKGHPPLISGILIDKIIEYIGDDGLKGILKKYDNEAAYIVMGNETALIDIDTKQHYYEALNYLNNKIMPSYEECIHIYNFHNVSKRVIDHCKKVGEVAKIIAVALKEKKCDINPDLVYFSGLLHDFKKGTPNHAEEAAKIIRKTGYEQVSEIIKNHMDIHESYRYQICNESLLYYADKIVKETKIIGIEDRLLKTNGAGNFQSDVNITLYSHKRLMYAKFIQDKIETALETKVIDLLESNGLGINNE